MHVVSAAKGGRSELVKNGKEREVVVRPVERRVVTRRNRCRDAQHGIVKPNAILRQPWIDAHCDRQIKRRVLPRQPAPQAADVALKENRVEVWVELIEKPGLSVLDLDACHGPAIVQRSDKRVKTLGGS